jgi:hypothetical protein
MKPENDAITLKPAMDNLVKNMLNVYIHLQWTPI